MKTVFTNKQLAHVWASQTQSHGRNSSNTMFFRDDTIYSYGEHYPMAKIYFKNGQRLVLVNEHRYSNTTGKQRGDVLNAISYKDYLYVPNVLEINTPSNERYLYNQVIENLENGFNTRKQYFSFEWLENSIKNLNVYLEFTGQKSFKLPELYYETLKEINKTRIDKKLERDALIKMKNERLAFEREQARLARIEQYRPEIELWPKGANKLSIPSDLFPREYDMIRIKPSEPETVETCRGAEVPLSHALRLMKQVLKGEAHVNERVGHFKVNAVKATTLTIGCHTINIEQAKSVLMPLLQRSEMKVV